MPDADRWKQLWQVRASLAYDVAFADYSARFAFIAGELLPELQAAFSLRTDAELQAFLETFAADYARSLGVAYGIGVSSGTTALTFALIALELEKGDEVLVPCYTYAATGLAVSNAGGAPVFIDAGRSPSHLDLDDLAAKTGPRTRGVIVAHLFGHMADPAPLMDYCRSKRLFLVEDACQAHGVRWEGQAAGTFGDAAAFSFNFTKLINGLGNGGMLVTGDAELARIARLLRDPESPTPLVLKSRRTPAYLDPLQAACVRAQMKAFDRIAAHHADLARRYTAGLSGLPLTLPRAQPGETPTLYWYVLRTPRRDALRAFLKLRGIETRTGFEPLSRLAAFRGASSRGALFPEAERLSGESLALPLGIHLEPADVERVIGAVSDYFDS